MNKCSLVEPYQGFLTETEWILDSFNVALFGLTLTAGHHSHRLVCEMAVLRLHDAWARFCRELVVLSAGCKPYTATGSWLALAPGITCRKDVIPKLLSTYNKTKYEPSWSTAAKCLDAAQRLATPNLSTVTAAVGATNSPAEELRNVRNFYAHRWQDTALKVK